MKNPWENKDFWSDFIPAVFLGALIALFVYGWWTF